ncbi:RagB/SusD family nutrient uptake outer membrane protein [Mucilaginibacter conchicola]|uniref:RagB/SusD family nutrient uptake outer membrane protein n=1 Tax=Mucilaginibacter conchicola TaxID=2303333 RepID=A0A372NXN7_9SPHI|nr:RagB/SusD family nutrient uptake outer membrane protein [Mucilaginibacter conchicola]RFZ94883.1 RagB/SusD family nutrient uptake outer membrane protein [Mucilaginibacter conchicola]
MKKIYMILAVLAISASSCKKDFIDLVPEDSYIGETFYKTPDQFRQAVIAAYTPLKDVLLNDYFTSEMHSDNSIYQPYPSNRGTAYIYREQISDFTNTSTNDYANAVWQHCYTGISRTNIVIERLPAATFDAAVKAPLDGEAKFLRAYYYFKLVRLYGGLPLFLKEVKNADDAFKKRATVDEVYAQIIADAKDAISELAPPAKFPQSGYATKGAATMLLAEVYATQKKWAEAETLLNTLSAMGYGLNANYADAFSPTNKNSKESIFEVQYLNGSVLGTSPNPLPFQFLPRSTNISIVLAAVVDGKGANINNSSTGGWNTPSQDLIDSYEPGDNRLDASIGIAEGTYNTSNLFVYSANKSIINYTPASGKVGVPYIKKYMHSPVATTLGTNDNFPIYRYSDALLLLAEAQNEQGKSPMTALSAVRSRAGLTTASADPGTLRNVIAHERRVELAFENHRWNDLVRTGKAIETVNAFGDKLRTQVNYLTSDAYKLNQNKLLFPIPQYEVELNPSGMIQNPGY